jgi:hypothetical protein
MQKKNQKVIMVILLGVVMLSVGVWQWQSMSGTTPEEQQEGKPSSQEGISNSQSSQQPDQTNNANPAGNQVVANLATLPVRDPFTPEQSLVKNPEQPQPDASRPTVISGAAPRTISGSLPPLPPMSVHSGNDLRFERTDPEVKPEPPTPDWQVVGVVQGPKTLAIVKDGEGNRRFVRQGESLGDGFRVESVRRGEIVVRGHGQKHTLKVGSGEKTEE